MIDLDEIWNADKELSIVPDWKRREKSDFVRLVCPLDVDEITQEGLYFTGSANVYLPDRSVTFQVEFLPPRTDPRKGPMARIDWRPRSPHNNKGKGPPEYRMINQTGSHIHAFDLNWNASIKRMRGHNLPIAIPIFTDLRSYSEALDFVENEFRIKGVTKLPLPPWTSKLL